MQTFEKQIHQFETYGKYEYVFDEGGNLVFKEDSAKFTENYLSIPLVNYFYDQTKISSFYSTEFEEFIPEKEELSVVTEVSEEMSLLSEENQQLKTKLDEMTQISDANITEAERMAIKSVIIELRAQLKQGIGEKDFSTEFPYLPLTRTQR